MPSKLLFLFFLVVGPSLRGAVPAFSDFNSGQFSVTGNKVNIKSGVIITNLTYPGLISKPLRTDASGVISEMLIGANLSFDGTTLSAAGGGGGGGLEYNFSPQFTATAVTNITIANGALVTNITLIGNTSADLISVTDEAYNATTWNGSSLVPTKNALRDKFETIGGGSATNLTPWTSNINGNQFGVTNSLITSIERMVNVKTDFGALGNDTGDDSAAIQAALDFCLHETMLTNGDWTIYFPAGIYRISNASYGGNGENGQILFPKRTNQWVDGDPRPGIRLKGVSSPSQWIGTSSSGIPTKNGSIIKTTMTNQGAVFTSQGNPSTTPNFLTPVFQNLIFQKPDNSECTILQLSNVTATAIYDCSFVSANQPGTMPAAGPGTNSCAIDMPRKDMSSYQYLGNINISGFWRGIRIGEHLQASGLINIVGCRRGLSFKIAQHPNHIENAYISGCEYGITFEGATVFNIDCLQIERQGAGDWRTTVYDIQDSGNFGKGVVHWNALDLATSANAHRLKKLDGDSIMCYEISEPGLSMLSTSSTITPSYLRGPHHLYVDNSARYGGMSVLKARGTPGAPTVITAGDTVGSYAFAGYDGANYQEAADVRAVSAATISAGNVPMGVAIYTGTNSTTKAQRMLVDKDGNVNVQGGVLTATNAVLPGATGTFLPYDATSWNGSDVFPTRDDVRDKIEALSVGGGSPGGSDTHVQFNDAATFGGEAGFTYNKTTDSATLAGNLTVTGEAYDATGWDGDNTVPTKNDVRDKIETLGAGGGIGYTISLGSTSSSPADGATAFTGGFYGTPTTPTIANVSIDVPKTGTLKRIYLRVRVIGTLGTTESTSNFIRINDTTDVGTLPILLDAASRSVIDSSVSQAVTVGDTIVLKSVYPTFATNPTSVSYFCLVYIE